MNDKNDEGLNASDLAAERLAEIDRLTRSIRVLLEQMIAAFENGDNVSVKEVLNKLSELQAAHLKVITAEDTFHAKTGTDPDADAIDYDEIRCEVGCRLDRLRQSLLAEAVSGDVDTGTIGDIALSVRFLGDAAPDRTKR